MTKLKQFKPQRSNANKHTERGLSLLDKSIRQDGWIGAVTVAADGETFDGSARLETIATVMGESDPIIVDVDGTRPVILRRTDIESADDPRAKRLSVAANAIASADWNPDGDLLAVLAAEDDLIRSYAEADEKSLSAIMKSAEMLTEETEEIKTLNYWHVLISVPIDLAMDVKEKIEKLSKIAGVEIEYGAN